MTSSPTAPLFKLSVENISIFVVSLAIPRSMHRGNLARWCVHFFKNSGYICKKKKKNSERDTNYFPALSTPAAARFLFAKAPDFSVLNKNPILSCSTLWENSSNITKYYIIWNKDRKQILIYEITNMSRILMAYFHWCATAWQNREDLKYTLVKCWWYMQLSEAFLSPILVAAFNGLKSFLKSFNGKSKARNSDSKLFSLLKIKKSIHVPLRSTDPNSPGTATSKKTWKELCCAAPKYKTWNGVETTNVRGGHWSSVCMD